MPPLIVFANVKMFPLYCTLLYGSTPKGAALHNGALLYYNMSARPRRGRRFTSEARPRRGRRFMSEARPRRGRVLVNNISLKITSRAEIILGLPY